MMTQEKFRDKKKSFDGLWSPRSSVLCIVYQHYESTRQQKHVLNRKDQPSPSVNSSLKENLAS